MPMFMNPMQQQMMGQAGMYPMMMPQQQLMPPQPDMAACPQVGMQPQLGNAGSHESGRSNRRSRSPARDLSTKSGRIRFDDDDRKISSTYKTLGLAAVSGERRCTPKRFRATCCSSCDEEEYPMVRTSQLGEEETDCLVYILCGVLPDTRMADLGCSTKGEVRDCLRSQYKVKNRKNANRLQALGDELDNLVLVAARMQYPMKIFSGRARAFLAAMSDQLHQQPAPPGAREASLGEHAAADRPMGQLALADALQVGENASSGSPEAPRTPKPETRERRAEPVPEDAQDTRPTVSLSLPALKLPRFFARAAAPLKPEKVKVVEPVGAVRDFEAETLPLTAPGLAPVVNQEPTATLVSLSSSSQASAAEIEAVLAQLG